MVQDPSWEKWLRIREARTQIHAIEVAPDDADVIRWRAQAFADREGRLLKDEEVETWVEQYEDPIPLPDMSDAKARLDYFAKRKATPTQRWIENYRASPAGTWFRPSGEGFQVIPIAGSILDEGCRLAESLAAQLGWTDESAIRWLLTGVLPTGRPVAELLSGPEPGKVTPQHEVTLRIPIEIPPDAVAELYQLVRGMAASKLKDLPAVKNTPISEKSLRATVFALERSQSGDAWGDVFDEWTRYAKSQRKEWGFASTQSFISATRKTYKRLTGRDLQWKRQRGERK